MAGGVISGAQIFGLTMRESADDGSDFTNPGADYRRVFLGEDGTIKLKDSSGTVTSLGGSGIPATIFDAQGDIIIASAADTAARLARGSAAQVLVSTSTTVAWADVLPWHIQVVPMIATADATTGTWDAASTTGSTSAGLAYPFYVPGSTANSGGAQILANNPTPSQNDAWAIDLVFAAGTWDMHAWVRKSTNTGIITLQQDGADMGTVDTYAAAAVAAKVSITGWSVSTTGKKRMNFKMATKNGSSSGYAVSFFGMEFHRTA